MTAEDRFSGAIGAELSDEGRRQAARLGDRLQDDGIVAVYASPLARSADTARIIAGACGVQPVMNDGLRGSVMDPGSLTRREVEERFPGDYAAWEEDPFTFAQRGPSQGCGAGAGPALVRRIVTAHQGQSVLVARTGNDPPAPVSVCLHRRPGYRDRSTSPRRA